MTKETGIIMSGNHPKLILEGRKTQTRRVINPQPAFNSSDVLTYWLWKGFEYSTGGLKLNLPKKCPYGQVGDRLWVKETWATQPTDDLLKPCEIPWYLRPTIIYKAQASYFRPEPSIKWRPSIFMPRWASRILLEITEIRVERLREITLADVIAEGFGDATIDEFNREFLRLNPKLKETNPWVWVISFATGVRLK